MIINKKRVKELLKNFEFEELFLEEIGWDEHKIEPQIIEIKDDYFTLLSIAQKRGVQVFLCQPDNNGLIPVYEKRKKIDTKVYKFAHEHLIIFIDLKKTRQIWMWVSREPNKPAAYRQIEFITFQSGEELIQKLNQIAFTLDEEEGLTLFEVSLKLKDALDKDKVTKKFYDRFKKEHDEFLKMILGISKDEDSNWYASLLLNRLMFIYFIQKKGFLDNDLNYLTNRLHKMKIEYGQDKFYSFYQYFLLKLFHFGLGSPQRNPELEKLLGKIPYLNGGLFDIHKLEKEYDNIQISDKAFENIFAFFDAYDWHLDNRPIVKGNEVNPDVIGYIFEKYINQKQMGAYYTKEDITDYISKNTIIPFILDEAKKNCKIAFIGENNIWILLQENPDKYFYDAVKKGCNLDLPEEIEIGVDPEKPNLFERRKNWNKLADEEYALPTEIWREVVDRRQRYFEVKEKMEKGEINSINDFITYNLNIRQFTQDVIDNAEGPELIRAFYKAVNEVSILDPTCGSGAFLFAALNILEEIYEALIERMESFIFDLENAKEKYRSDKYSDFKKTISEINKHTSRKYFIYKSIIINNLYGVDIMDEAIEIAKLRLFLKLASVFEKDDNKPNMGIEPLPDIDFHLKAGNTLIGFTSKNEIERVIEDDIINKMYIRDLPEKLEIIDKDYKLFNEMQKKASFPEEEYHKAKNDLENRLYEIRNRLNQFLAEDYGQTQNFDIFLETHKPFHWFIEFYHIMHKGGFDVIIGNPPYVEYSKIREEYEIKNYKTKKCGNLYVFTFEKSINIMRARGRLGLIVPISSTCSMRMKILQKLLMKNNDSMFISSFSERPSKLFVGAEISLNIVLLNKGILNNIYTSKVNRWYSENRKYLFGNIRYTKLIYEKDYENDFYIPKFDNIIENYIIDKISKHKTIKILLTHLQSDNLISYRTAGGRYFKLFKNSYPPNASLSDKVTFFQSEYDSNVLVALYNSNLFWWYYINTFDMYNLKDYLIFGFRFNYDNKNINKKLINLSHKLMEDFEKNIIQKKIYHKTRGEVIQNQNNPKMSKPIIDEIDKVLAAHYGFTDEELDFIINYDIKYRMGKDWIKQ